MCLLSAAVPGSAQVAGRDTAASTGTATAPPASSVMSDAQIEANVVRSLAASKTLAGDNITTTAVFGKVTLTGVVTDEASRELAETLASHAAGVKLVVDSLTIGTPTPPDNSGPDPAAGNVAPMPGQPGQAGAERQAQQLDGPNGPWNTPEVNQRGQYHSGGGTQAEAAPAEPAAPPLRPQVAGEKVVIQGGAAIYARIMEELDSRHVRAGMPFQGTVLNDIVADDTVAIPRGAIISGVIVESKHPGFWSGVGSLVLQANSVQMNGQTVPLVTYMWAAPNARAFLPAEAVVRFRLQRAATVVTVSQSDLARLAASVPLLKGVPPENDTRARQRYGTNNPDPGYTDDPDY